MENKLYLVSILVLFIPLISFGQGNLDSLSSQKPLSASRNLILKIDLASSFYDNRPNYIYNDSKDTIRLSSVNSSYGHCSCALPKVVSEIQIDQKGAKEVVFYRKCRIVDTGYQSSYRQTTTTTLKKYEIWNLDTKTLLFAATNYCRSKFDGIHPNPAVVPRQQKRTNHYQYDFRVNKIGNIQIKHLRGKLQDLAEIKEGTYLFVDGKYVLKE